MNAGQRIGGLLLGSRTGSSWRVLLPVALLLPHAACDLIHSDGKARARKGPRTRKVALQ